jgi:ABC-type multidrug transport system ATPase subunit
VTDALARAVGAIPDPAADVLHADCIAKTLGGRRVLTSATLHATGGRVTALLGRMGAGKSTLLAVCAGVLAADSGWVAFGGRREQRPRHAALAAAGLLYLADARNLLDAPTVRAQYAFVTHRFPGGSLDRAVELLRLHELLDRKPPTLSGGERRRAELGLALVRAPRCLLADEPFRGIDPLAAELLGRALHALADDGCAVVVTGHEVSTLMPWADDVVWVTAGTTHPLGAPAAAWRDDTFRREYLGPALAAAGPPERPAARPAARPARGS